MAKVVGGFLMSHSPGITNVPKEACDQRQWENMMAAFGEIKRRVRDLRADTVVIVGDDHYTNFGPHCIPQCLIAIGDVDGPVEEFLGIKSGPIPNNEPLARHILNTGFSEGIGWAFAKALSVDHAVAIPYHMTLKDNPNIRVVPVYLNEVVEPFIPSQRAFEIGRSIRRAIESWQGDERVVVYGTGGLSHWVGTEGVGRVNAELDRHLLALCEAGDIDSLIALSDQYVVREGGNGCLEIKNWICAMGAMPPGAKCATIAYEPMPQMITGMGFAEVTIAA